MLRLDATTKIFQLSATASADVDVSGLSVTSAAATGFNEVTAATATTQTIAAAPAASTVKQVDYISIKNTGAGTNTVTVKKFNSSGSVTTQLAKATLAVDETLIYTHAGGWQTLDATGSKKVGTAGWVIAAGKIGTLSNSLTLAGTDGTTMTFPATSASIARTDVAQTFTGTTHNDFHVTGVNGLGSKGAIYLFSDAKTAGDAINFPMYLTNSADAVKAYASMRATITNPTAGSEGGTIAFNTIAAGVTGDRFAMVGNSGIAIPPGYKMWFDGTTATGDTYITESSANVLDLYAGGVNTLKLSATAATITGTGTISGAFGCNTKAAQTAYASGGALAAYGAGANGFDSGANASALHAMVVSIRAALVANGIMS